jgi:hypothetical protein
MSEVVPRRPRRRVDRRLTRCRPDANRPLAQGMRAGGHLGTSWPALKCVECVPVVGWYWPGVGVRPREVHRGPRCQNASDGAAVKGAASAVREAQAEGPTLTGATPMPPSWRVREGMAFVGCRFQYRLTKFGANMSANSDMCATGRGDGNHAH